MCISDFQSLTSNAVHFRPMFTPSSSDTLSRPSLTRWYSDRHRWTRLQRHRFSRSRSQTCSTAKGWPYRHRNLGEKCDKFTVALFDQSPSNMQKLLYYSSLLVEFLLPLPYSSGYPSPSGVASIAKLVGSGARWGSSSFIRGVGKFPPKWQYDCKIC